MPFGEPEPIDAIRGFVKARLSRRMNERCTITSAKATDSSLSAYRGRAYGWADEKWALQRRSVHPGFVAHSPASTAFHFPPLRRGGQGG